MRSKMKVKPHVVLGTVAAALALALSYGLVFAFYVSGLFGDGRAATPALWEKVLRRTILLSPFVTAFLLLAVAAWKLEWESGVLPWGFGAAAVLLLARWDAGILGPADPVLLGVALFFAWRLTTGTEDEEEGP